MLGVGGAGQRQHPDRLREAEHDLGRRGLAPRGKAGDQRVAQHLRVGGEEREALVDDRSIPAERSNVAVPAEAGEAAVLDERRGLGAGADHLLEVPQPNVAHAEKSRAAGGALLHHRGPDLGVVLGPAGAGGGTVQHVAVDVVGPEVLERAGQRLGDLRGEVGRGVVGQPVVLAGLVGEFRL